MSYFNHPVKVAVFQTAIFGLVERLIRLGGRIESVVVQVLFTGDTACAVWSHSRHCDPDKPVIRGVIKLPALKEGSIITREKANRWVAYTIHEVWHILFTDSVIWSNFAKANPGLRAKLANALEDARIERSGMELGYANGFKVVGKELLQHLMIEGAEVNPNDPRQIPWVFAVGCRAYGIKGERRLLSALDPRIKTILNEAKRRVDQIPATIDAKSGTKATNQIALWVYGELTKLGSHDAPTPLPPPPPPPRRPPPPDDGDEEGEDKEGEPSDEEREEGDADDESYDEEGQPGDEGGGEPGDGPPGPQQPLKVGDKVICPDKSVGVISAINGDDAEVSPL